MTTQPVEANVVLTANNSQYDQAMNTSASTTDQLGQSVDTLSRKIGNLTKTAGRSLIGISAADVASITAATAAYSNYEKQVSRLNAQAAVLTRTQSQQSAVMKDYTRAVNTLRMSYGTSTAEAAKLVETLSKITTIRQSRDLTDLSKVFVDMSHATGESSEGLAQSLTNLQRVMGTPINSQNTRKYADQFTYLAAQTQTSAQGLIDFTAQLAPIGQQIGLTQTQLAGFATAFTRSGQEGYTAANAFSKMVSDISYSMQTGSNQLSTYANLVGKTNKQFSELSGQEKLLEVFEALQSQGDRAITTLNQLGLDGPRTMRALTAVSQQSGGLRQALGLAQQGTRSDAAAEGAAASMKSLNDEWDKFTQHMQHAAETMGSYFMPVMEKFVQGMDKAAQVIDNLTQGPMGKFLAMIMGVIAPLAGGAGALLLFSGALLKVATAFMAFNNSATRGAWEGLRGGTTIARGPNGTFLAREGGALGTRGQQIAQGGTWFQRGLYNAGALAGGAFAGGTDFIRDYYQAGRSAFDPNYQPGPRRNVLSYMAGGAGRAIETFLTPQFDQMRYPNPADRYRSRMFGRYFPGTSPVPEAEGAVDEAKARARATQAVYESVSAAQGTTPDQVERARRDMHRANQEAVRTQRDLITAQTEAARVTRGNSREVENNTRGFARLGQAALGYAGGAAGGVIGAGRMGLGALMRSGMAGPMAGTAALMGMSALGVQSDALMGAAAMGSMFGGPGALIGLGVGAYTDAARQNKQFQDIQAARRAALQAGVPSGILQANQAAMAEFQPYQTQQERSYWQRFTHPQDILGNIGRGFGAARQWLTGGGNAYTTREQEARAARNQTQDLASALSTISTARGNRLGQLDLTNPRDIAKLDDVMNQLGPTMDKLNISTNDLVKTYSASGSGYGGYRAWQDLVEALSNPDVATGVANRMGTTAAGRALMGAPQGERAIMRTEDVSAAYRATHEAFREMRESGMSYLDIVRSTERTQSKIKDDQSQSYKLEEVMNQMAQERLQATMPLMTTGQRFQATMGFYQSVAQGIGPQGPQNQTQLAQLTQARQMGVSAIEDQVAQIKQELLMQEQYERQRARAQRDYTRQVSYEQYDFNLQRSRAEYEFHLQRTRATQDFYRQQSRAEYDFQLQRTRAEEDFRHQVSITGQQMAIQQFNIYQRIPTERTAGASWMLANMEDQLRAMREQERNLDELRKLGFTDQALQQLQLTDPANAQQTARFLAEVRGNRGMVRQFNRVARRRQAAAQDLYTDPSNLEYTEARRALRIQLQRGQEDFDRARRQSTQDFNRTMGQQKDDFDRMLGQQATDFQTMMNRQETAYNTSMHDAAVDLAHAADEISGSLFGIIKKGATDLSGSAQTQAKQVLRTFRDLRQSTNPVAVSIMQDLADIFGFQYTVPKGVHAGASGNGSPGITGSTNATVADAGLYGSNTGRQHLAAEGPHAMGGVLPGYTPGRDVYNINVSGGEGIMRPEWVRAVGGKAAVDAMNHAAMHGGAFAGGGIFRPIRRPVTRGLHDAYTGYTAIDFAAPVGTPVYAVESGRITRSYDITGIEPRRTGYGKPQDGYRSYGRVMYLRTVDGPEVLYAHLSRRGYGAGTHVTAGDPIGLSGDTGNSTGPHLHFGDSDGNPYEFASGMAGSGTLAGSVSAGRVSPAARRSFLRQVLQDRYKGPEAAAWALQGVHPLGRGDISRVINRFARNKINELMGRFGSPVGDTAATAPSSVSGAVRLGQQMAAAMGWTGNDWNALYQLWQHESGWNVHADNPTSSAYGIPQALPGSKMATAGADWHDNAATQIKWGLNYIKNRPDYGNPSRAWALWQSRSPHWYGNGSVFTQPKVIGVGENGPEAVIPLNGRGSNFMAEVMGSVMGGRNMAVSGRGMNVFAKIDRSTNFTGPITVQANDPAELINKLKARQRVMALSRPTLTGSAA